MPKITFLASTVPLVPLTKTIASTSEGIKVTPYPRAWHFTSDTVDIATISDFCKILARRQHNGECLLKGTIHKHLKNEQRAGSTKTGDFTEWVCFDLDKAPFATPAEFMKVIKMNDVAHVVQYSASHGLPGNKGLSCHIFAFLSKPMSAPQLKSWLMYLNFNTKELRDALRLSNSAISLSYPLDITCCQNDKLLFFGAPTFVNMKDPMKGRIEYIAGKKEVIDVERIALHAPDALRKMAKDLCNERRGLAQLPKLTGKVVVVGEYEVQNLPGEWSMTGGPRYEREFVYFNVGAGKNWSYFHPEGNYELIHNFKGEPSVRTKEVFPEYYKDCVRARNAQMDSPTSTGDEVLAFRDRHTMRYWHGTWNPGTGKLVIDPAKNEIQIEHFLLSKGRTALPFIPVWEQIFDPSKDALVVDRTKDVPTVNLFTESYYMRTGRKLKQPSLGGCPTIARIIEHCVGSGDILEHFYNWLAVLFQLRKKPRTAWVIHGVQGSGKDMIVDRILTPIFGEKWVVSRNQTELNSDFTGWIEFALIAHIREIEIDSLENGAAVESKIKNYITDVTVPIRKMRTDSYAVPNYTGTLFSSNKPQPVRIPVDDRRFNVGRFQTEKLVVSIHEVEHLIPQELPAFADYLTSRQADRNLAGVPLRTKERDDIMALSMTSADHSAQYIRDGNLEGLWEAMPDMKSIQGLYGMTPMATYAAAYDSLLRRCLADYQARQPSKVTREELGSMFQYLVGNVPTTPNKLTSYLAHHGITLKRMRIGVENRQGIEIEWSLSDAFIKELSESPKPEGRKVIPMKPGIRKHV